MLAQICTSATNFIFTAFLIKNMSLADFGVFSILFSLAFFLGGAVSATTSTQMAVYTGEIHPTQTQKFISLMMWRHYKISSATGAILISASFIFSKTLPITSITTETAACFLAALAYSHKDFILKVLYEKKQENSLLILNITTATTLLLIMATALHLQIPVTPEVALFSFSAANITPSLLWQIKLKIKPIKNRKHKTTLISWKNSAHNLVAHTLSNLRSQGYIYITGFILGSPAVAALNAARMIAMPAFVIVPAITQRMIPSLSKSISTGDNNEISKIKRKAENTTLWVGVVVSLLMLIIYPVIENIIFSKYEDNFSYAAIWLIIAIISGARAVNETALVAGRQFSTQSRLNLYSLVILIFLSSILSLSLGAIGALIALLISEAAFLIQARILTIRNQR